MKQLSGLDASFLYLETGSQFGHVTGLGVFERPDTPGWSPYEAVKAKLGRRLGDLEPFRRRLVEVPFGLDHPFWILDPDFDIEFHVRETAVPAPGTKEQLAQLAARLIARPLDRRHPLWECYVIDGIEENRFGVLTKVHHATVDGAAGAELMTIFYDYEPGMVEVPEGAHVPPGERIPTAGEILSKVVAGSVTKPGKFVGLQIRTLRAVGEMTRNRGLTGLAGLLRTIPNPIGARVAIRAGAGEDGVTALPENTAPPTPFNGTITPHRRVALRSAPLADVKAIKAATGATVNDVVMAACAGGLRRYLLKHDALPDRPLVAMVPVSIRTGEEADPWTNRVSGIFAMMPTTAEEPLERLRQMQKIMDDAKDRFTLLPAAILVDYAEFAPPALAVRAARVASRLRIADRLHPPLNLVVSNVPGPRRKLYLDHAEMVHYYPVSTIVDGVGLNITVQSYTDIMDFALVACREMVPDLDDLADFVIDEISVLGLAAGVVDEAPAAPPKRRPAKRI
jgi:WS/DGAT/MGAT family acyltransferase